MKFKIYSRTHDGKEIFHIYDNITQDIITSEDIPVYLDKDPRCQALLKKSYRFNLRNNFKELYKKRDIKELRITLGFNCNFSCKYCNQHQVRDTVGKNDKIIVIHEDLETKVNNLVALIKENIQSVDKIVFWGGEPLVYFKTLKLLLPKLRKLFPKVSFGTVSNGSLFTLPIAKWCIENKLNFTMSHDGPSFNTYRDNKNPLEDPKVLEGIHYYLDHAEKEGLGFSFNIVVTPENSKLELFNDYFENILGRPVRFHFESIAKLDTFASKVITPFNKESSQNVLNSIVAFASTADNKHPYFSLRDHTSLIIRRFIGRKNMNTIPGYCNVVNEEFVAIDMQGNLLTCHGSSETFGHISTLEQHPYPLNHTWKNRKGCAECPFLVSCIGGCYVANDEDHQTACVNLKIWHAGFFISAWKLLFNSTIHRIEPLLEDKNDNCN